MAVNACGGGAVGAALAEQVIPVTADGCGLAARLPQAPAGLVAAPGSTAGSGKQQAQPGHALTHPFAVFGVHAAGSTGTLFLSGIEVRVIGLPGLSLLLTGARRARRGRAARRASDVPV